jgi:hypothetical protein
MVRAACNERAFFAKCPYTVGMIFRHARLSVSRLFDPRHPREVMREVRTHLAEWYEPDLVRSVARHFRQVNRLYRGKIRGFRACNTEYHDLRHLHSVLLAAVRLLDGCNLALPSILPADQALALCLAALYYESGFLQESWDVDGTGAKYTRIHIRRSHDFIRTQAARLRIPAGLVDDICLLASATDLAREWNDGAYPRPGLRLAACILGSADILGQMADRIYLEKLLFLYYELREAAFSGMNTAFDIIRETSSFYDAAQDRLHGCLGSVDRHLAMHFKVRHGIDSDLYREAIDRQMNYLQVIIDDPHKNFRTKLRRLDLNAHELGYYA